MKRNKGVGQYIIAILLVFFFLFPVIYIIFSAFKGPAELFSANPTLIPKEWTMLNFKNAFGTDFQEYIDAFKNFDFAAIVDAFENGGFVTYVINSFVVAISSTFLAVIVNTMSGYALAKFRFKGDTIIMIIILSTIMLPLEIIMVPIFTVLRTFDMIDTRWALIIPAAATPTGIFLMRQYLLTIPDEVIQSARIDGASEWRIFRSIIIPNAKPAIATLAIFSFMWRWNDYIWPRIAINSQSKYTLQLAIANFSGQYGNDYGSIIAVSAFSMIPMLIVFLIFQRQFVQGTASSGMKG